MLKLGGTLTTYDVDRLGFIHYPFKVTAMSGSKIKLIPSFKKALVVTALLYPTLTTAFSFNALDLTDLNDINPGDGICQNTNGGCSLRAAIQEANAWPGPDSINLTSGTYLLTQTGSDNNAVTGDLDITESLNLTGKGSVLTIIDAGGIDRIVETFPGNSTVNISGITLTNGNTAATGGGAVANASKMTISDSVLTSNTFSGGIGGGGALLNTCELTLNSVDINNNQSTVSTGGAIFNGTASILVASHTTISNNTAENSGGGILNNGTISLSNSTIENNNSTPSIGGSNGGGIYNAGTAHLDRSLINNNHAILGGGFLNGANGAITLSDSTISNNDSPETWNGTPSVTGSGGGLYIQSGTAQLNRLTIANNRANISGGGIRVANGASLTISNSLISDNTVGFSATPPTVSNCTVDNGGILTSANNNLVNNNDSSCGLNNTNDVQAQSFILPALASLGGATQTFAIPSGSVADNGGACITGATDQRGVARTIPGCDIGAYELGTSDPGSWSDIGLRLSYSPHPVVEGDNTAITLTASNHGPATSTAQSITSLIPTGLSYISDDSATSSTTYNNTSGSWAAGTFTTGLAKSLTLLTSTDAGISTSITQLAASTTDQNPSNDSASLTLDINADIGTHTDLGLSSATLIDGSPASNIIATTPFTYQFIISNNGSAIARNSLLTISLPVEIEVLATNGCSLNNQILTCALGDVASGVSLIQNITAKPNTLAGSLNTTAQLNFTGIDSDSSDNVTTVNTSVLPKSVDLAITITPSATQIVEGNVFSYGIAVTNNGIHAASDVKLTLNLPTDTIASVIDPILVEKDFQTRPLLICDATGLIRTCLLDESLLTLTSGDSVSLTLFMTSLETPDNADTLINFSATVSSSFADDPDTTNNSVSTQILATDATGTISPESDLSIELSVGPEQIFVTDPITLTAVVTNNGNNFGIESQALGTSLTFTVPTTMTVDIASLPINCSINGNQVACDWPDVIWANGAVSSRIIVSTPTANSYLFSATATTSTDTINLVNNNTQVTAIVEPEPSFRPRAGNGCFIATAAYGSYLDQHVLALRQFRDNILMTSATGRWLVDLYYQTSPPIAAYISQHDNLLALTRFALTPVVYMVEYPVGGVSLGIALIGSLLVLRRRQRIA